MNDLQIRVMYADWLRIGREWNSRDVRSPYWRFYINGRDGASVSYGGGEYALPAGRVHLIPAYVRFSCRNTRVLEHLYAHFDVLGITPVLQQRLFPAPLSLPASAATRRLWRLFAAGERPERSAALLCRMQAAILEAMGEAIAGLPGALQRQLQVSFERPSPVRAALKLTEERLPRGARVAELAEACGLSPDHFARVFRRETGQSPAQYVRQARLAGAARELLYGTESIEAIAERHGFANRFHFTRAFSREIGSTPAAYRRSQRM